MIFLLNKDDPELMRCYDGINNRYGNGTLQLTAEGQVETWQMRREFLSPSFVSMWCDVPKVLC
jgi:DNA polymerase V